MNMRILFVITILIGVNGLSDEEYWNHFKKVYNKTYDELSEEKHRYGIFQSNLNIIDAHNARYEAGLETYTMAANQFADLTSKEFSEKLKLQKNNRPRLHANRHFVDGSAPESIDWRETGAVSRVKDQGTCASCWAFSSTGSLEGQNAILRNVTDPLSEQQLLDCSGDYGNGDCIEGGFMIFAFEYVQDHGIETEDEYPYMNEQYTCKASGDPFLTIKGYKQVDKTEEALKDAVGTIGPISVAVYSTPIQFYSGGIFKSDVCYNTEEYLDHGMLVVGYGVQPEPYWIVKNSWNTWWGEQGYIRIARNANQCGITLDASYPVL